MPYMYVLIINVFYIETELINSKYFIKLIVSLSDCVHSNYTKLNTQITIISHSLKILILFLPLKSKKMLCI